MKRFLKLGGLFLLVFLGMAIVDIVLNHGIINMAKDAGFSVGALCVYYWKTRKAS